MKSEKGIGLSGGQAAGDGAPDRVGDFFYGARCVDANDTVGLASGNFLVAEQNAVVEFITLLFHARLVGCGGRVALESACNADRRVDVEPEREVRAQRAAGDRFDTADDVGAHGTSVTLIGHGGVSKTVGNDDFALGQRGADNLGDVLCARREVEQQFSSRVEVRIGLVEQNLTDVETDAGAAGLLHADGRVSLSVEASNERFELGSLTAAVNTFESQEKSTRSQTASIPGEDIQFVVAGR